MHSPELKYPVLRLLITVMILVMLSFRMAGQSNIMTRYTSKEGIGHDNVRKIVADSSGFIWMATWDGLTRYDGTDFINYYHDPADSTTIPYFSVASVVIDAKDDLWILTDNGVISLFDRSREEFRVVSSIDGHSLNDLINFNSGPDGFLYFMLTKELLRYDPKTGKTVSYLWSKRLENLGTVVTGRYSIVFEASDMIWLTGPEIIEVELSTEPVSMQGKAIIKSVNRIQWLPERTNTFPGMSSTSRITHDVSGNMWIASAAGLFRHDGDKKLFREYDGPARDLAFADTLPLAFYRNREGLNVWFPQKDSILIIPQDICGLPTDIFFYGRDLLWFSNFSEGGTPQGVVKAVFTPYEFRHINPFPLKNSALNVFGINIDTKGNLWLAVRDRNYLIRIGPEGLAEKINVLNEIDLARLWHPRAFLNDETGLWIGYFNKSLFHYDLANEKLEEHKPTRMVHTICWDNEGRILIADSGILRFDPRSGRSERILEISDTINLFTIHRDKDIVWVGCSDNLLLRYDMKSGAHELIRLAKGQSNLEDICTGDDGKLWIATLGTGVCQFDPETGEKVFYTTASGLSNNTTYSVLKDDAGNIWASTNNGISVINPGNGLIRSFGENDGLAIHEFNSDASFISEDGRFLFGGVGGAVEFDPEQILREHPGRVKPGIIIKELEVSALKRTLDKPVYKADTILLNKGDDNFHISFVVPEYRHPEKVRYRYRIDSGSDNWYYTDYNDRNINFSNLQPGWYNLEIQATDISGSWGNPKEVVIYLEPFFYQTVGFLIALPLTIIILLSLVAWTVIRQMKHREQQKRDTLRHQALRGQMNPHFIFNSLNSINYFISNNDRMSANRYIADFSKLIRTVLTNMNEEYVRLSVEMGSLEDYMKIEHLRFGDKFDYAFEVDPEIRQEAVKVSPGLIQPFVENAIWHGVMGLEDRKGMIKIALQRKEGKLVCVVEDDGVGRERSEAMKDKSLPKRSQGIALAVERLKIINNLQSTDHKIRITDVYPGRAETGTKVEIEIPVTE